MVSSNTGSPARPDLMYPVRSAIAPLVGLVAIAVGTYLLPRSCVLFQHIVLFSGTEARFDAAMQLNRCDSVSLREARVGLLLASLLFLAGGAVLGVGLARIWPNAWRARPFTTIDLLWLVPVVSGAFGVVATVWAQFGLRSSGRSVVLNGPLLDALPILAWPAAMGLVLSAVLLFLALIGWYGSAKVPATEEGAEVGERVTGWPSTPYDVGICCSGGGIRAGAFAIGALSALESVSVQEASAQIPEQLPEEWDSLVSTRLKSDEGRKPSLLDASTYLASVSGGGYLAGAWRIARGINRRESPGEDGADPADPDLARSKTVIGNPYDPTPIARYPDRASFVSDGSMGLYRHARNRRHFLSMGRGGLLNSAVFVVFGVFVNLLVLGATVYLLAWPVGRVAGSWPVLGLSVDGEVADITTWKTLRRLLLPLGLPLALLVAATVFRTLTLPTKWRAWSDIFSLAMVAWFGLLAVPLAVGPLVVYAVDTVEISTTDLILLSGSTGGVGAVLVPILNKFLARRIAYLGGILLGVAAIGVAALVMQDAATRAGLFAFEIDGNRFLPWLVYGAIALGLALAWRLDPGRWSLHELYRRRLREAFALTSRPEWASEREIWAAKESEGTSADVFMMDKKLEPLLDAYADDDTAPESLICASVARSNCTITGIPALSFVFSPKQIAIYDLELPSGGRDPEARSISDTTSNYLSKIGSNRRDLGTMTTAMAVSAAAVSPSMGRMSLGTTNALFAAANLRLGRWMPNPLQTSRNVRLKKVRLNYLFKEIFGWYDVRNDPFVYVTDGGHRENLGLVELLRRRCKLVVCIDASGDRPGSFSTLWQAAALAEAEVGVRIELDEKLLEPLRARSATTLPDSSILITRILEVRDGAECHVGDLVYIKSQIDADTRASLKARAAEDATFPDYPTTNQFLSPEAFEGLAALGSDLMERALDQEAEGWGKNLRQRMAQLEILRDLGPPVRAVPDQETEVLDQVDYRGSGYRDDLYALLAWTSDDRRRSERLRLYDRRVEGSGVASADAIRPLISELLPVEDRLGAGGSTRL